MKTTETIGDDKCDLAPDLPHSISDYPSVFQHGRQLLVCGGKGNSKSCLMLEGKIWHIHSNLTHERAFASSVTFPTGTYIFGGYTDSSKTTIEFLPFESSIWRSLLVKIPDPGFHTGCAVKISDEELVLIGGIDTVNRVLSFNIKTNDWKEYRQLNQRRWGHNCAVFKEKIIIAGGWGINHDNSNAFTEIIDLSTMQPRLPSEQSRDMMRTKGGLAVTTFEKKIALLAFGAATNPSKIIHVWDPEDETWKKTNSYLSEYKYAFGYAVVPRSMICPMN